MFRRKLLFVFAVVLVLGFVSCDNGTTKDTYYIAVYEISKATFDNLNFNVSPVDALTWVRAQPGTGSQPVMSRSGYNLEEMESFLREYFVNFSNESITRITNGLRNSGYHYSLLTNSSTGGYAFLYINKE